MVKTDSDLDRPLGTAAFGEPEETASSLIVMARGYGMNHSAMVKMAELAAARIPGARVECPNGLKEIFSKNAQPGQKRFQWFDKTFDPPLMHERAKKAAADFNAHVDVRRDALGLSDDRIALAGFSQGATIALYAAWARAAAVACVAAHSIVVPETLLNDTGFITSKPPILFLYGTEDEILPPDLLARSAGVVQASTPEYTECVIGGLTHKTSDFSRRFVVDYLKIHL